MRIDLAAWECSGLRCPDVTVDFRSSNGRVPKVALLQMPNGTGKTTTLQLLNATLNGSAESWEPAKVRSFRRKNDLTPNGYFKATLLIDGRPLTIELTLDYEVGAATYKSTNPGSGGVVQKWQVPPSVYKFLAPEFLSLFIFDGEFANRLLDNEDAEADRAVDALCQIYLLDHVSEFTKDFWVNSTRQQTAKTSTGLTKWQDVRQQLTHRQKTIKAALTSAKTKIASLSEAINDLDGKIQARLNSVEAVRERHEAAQLELATAQADVKRASIALMSAMRLPHALHPSIALQLTSLRENLDTLKLPENTSAQFFQELIREAECICGRPMTEHSVSEIKNRARHYLDAEDAGVINALKSDIEQFTSTAHEEDAGYTRVVRLAKELTQAVRREKDADGQVRALKQQLVAGGDDQLALWQSKLDEYLKDHTSCENLVAAIEGPGDPEEANDKVMSLSLIAKRLEEVKAKIAEITETVRLREQTDLIQSLVNKAADRARQRIKEELVQECNARLSKILANDPLMIEKIDRSIRLKDQDGASVGQTLSVGYTFLMSVLSRGNNDFPLIVDSPANPIDGGVRRRIARLIPELCTQFVAFTINTERPGFVDTLEESAEEVAFFTLFRKTPGTQRLMKGLPKGRYTETANAVLVDDKAYFYQFDIQDEEDESALQAAQ